MASVTIRFSLLLILVGLLFFFQTGASHPTALIPAFFGAVLFVLGLLARGDDAKRRMLVMHIAVTVALLGFIFPAARVVMGWMKEHEILLGMAVREEMVMAATCLVYVLFCVRSFITARKARLAS